jgi:hypothetical protein
MKQKCFASQMVSGLLLLLSPCQPLLLHLLFYLSLRHWVSEIFVKVNHDIGVVIYMAGNGQGGRMWPRGWLGRMGAGGGQVERA